MKISEENKEIEEYNKGIDAFNLAYDGAVEVVKLPFDHKNLPEVWVKTADMVKGIASKLNKPLLHIDYAVALDKGMKISNEHSIIAVISDGVIYKFVYDIKE